MNDRGIPTEDGGYPPQGEESRSPVRIIDEISHAKSLAGFIDSLISTGGLDSRRLNLFKTIIGYALLALWIIELFKEVFLGN